MYMFYGYSHTLKIKTSAVELSLISRKLCFNFHFHLRQGYERLRVVSAVSRFGLETFRPCFHVCLCFQN